MGHILYIMMENTEGGDWREQGRATGATGARGENILGRESHWRLHAHEEPQPLTANEDVLITARESMKWTTSYTRQTGS